MISKAQQDSEELSKCNADEAHAGLRDTIEELRDENSQLKKALKILAMSCATDRKPWQYLYDLAMEEAKDGSWIA